MSLLGIAKKGVESMLVMGCCLLLVSSLVVPVFSASAAGLGSVGHEVNKGLSSQGPYSINSSDEDMYSDFAGEQIRPYEPNCRDERSNRYSELLQPINSWKGSPILPIDSDPKEYREKTLSAVGVIACGTGGQVTPLGCGTVVHIDGSPRDVILTASHVVNDPKNGSMRSDCYFFPKGDPGQTPIKLHRSDGELGNATADNGNLSNDWAVIGLDSNDVHGTTGSLPLFTGFNETVIADWAKAGATYTQVGYESEKDRMVRSINCGPKKKSKNVIRSYSSHLLHSCSTTKGFSGCPLIISHQGRNAVACIHSVSLEHSANTLSEYDDSKQANGCQLIGADVAKAVKNVSQKEISVSLNRPGSTQ